MRQQWSDVAHRLFDVELVELVDPEQLVQLLDPQHLEHLVVELVLVDAVQLELVLVFVLDGIEHLQQLELLVRGRWGRRLEQLELVLVEQLGASGGRFAPDGGGNLTVRASFTRTDVRTSHEARRSGSR